MNRRRLLFLLGGWPLVAAAQRSPKPNFKGMEIYSWFDQGHWRYALLRGTNRNQQRTELLKEPLQEPLLRERLGQLAVGETVSWMLTCEGAPPGRLALPPRQTLSELQQLCLHLEIHLYLPIP